MTSRKFKAYKQGVWSERIAALYLMSKGYKIVAMRYKTPVGEIDILAKRGKVLVAVEVKYRPTVMEAQLAITPQSQTRIERAMRHFLSLHPVYNDYTLRFDVVSTTRLLRLQHLPNAWFAKS